MKNPIFLLLVCVPGAAFAHHSHASASTVFILSALAIVPMAFLLGEATEHLAERAGPAVGGFMNATFGNATELIIGAMGILKGGEAVLVIKASITGSILGNLLFILGLSMLAGGWGRKEQTFSRTAVGAGNAMMALAVAGLMLPSTVYLADAAHAALFAHPPRLTEETRVHLSLWVAGILMVSYFVSLFFSFVTHTHVFVGAEAEEAGVDHDTWPVNKAVGVLLFATLVVAWLSEMLIHTVEDAGRTMGLSPIFMGLVVVATVGNAAEHASAILVARRDKMDLAVQIAMGSATQIALFLGPALVLFSFAFAPSTMTLEFSLLEVMAVALAVNVAALVSLDGESNWFEGFQLVSLYALVAVAFYYLV